MKNKGICFINGAGPNFLGGISLYQSNLIKYIKSVNRDFNITWVYQSEKEETSSKEGINYVGLKCGKTPFVNDILFNIKVKKYLNKNYFDIINSHAIWGYWMKNYKKKKNQKLIHTYHGATYPYYKVHLKRFGTIKKTLLSPLLLYSYLVEKPPVNKADEIICVSEKVKEQIKQTYNRKENISMVRTGVNLNEFKPRDKNATRKKLNLEKDKLYGLYIGKGGYWIKGLDRAIKLSEEIYNQNKEYKLLVIGSDKNKVGKIIDKEFVMLLENIPREEMPYYYNAVDFLLALSRYEGGAPTLVVSEAMASECPIILSKDSQQEIIENEKDGIILDNFEYMEEERIINLLKDKKKMQGIVKSAIKKIKDISLDKWGKEYTEIFLK